MTNRLVNKEAFKSAKLTTKRSSDGMNGDGASIPLSYSSNSLLAHSEHIKFPKRKTIKYFTPTRIDPYALYNTESARSKNRRSSTLKLKTKAHLSARILQD